MLNIVFYVLRGDWDWGHNQRGQVVKIKGNTSKKGEDEVVISWQSYIIGDKTVHLMKKKLKVNTGRYRKGEYVNCKLLKEKERKHNT